MTDSSTDHAENPRPGFRGIFKKIEFWQSFIGVESIATLRSAPMSDQLSSFLESCHHDQAARCRLRIRPRVPGKPALTKRPSGPTRLLSELSKTFSVGRFGGALPGLPV